MHLIIENYKGGGGDEIKGLTKCFQQNEKLRAKYWDKLDDEYKNKIPQALKNVHWYLTKRYPLIKNFKHEECLDVVDFDRIGDVSIHLQGKLDGLYELSGKVWVTDFKSGKKTKNHSNQLGFYLFLLERLRKSFLGNRKVISLRVGNLRLGDLKLGSWPLQREDRGDRAESWGDRLRSP